MNILMLTSVYPDISDNNENVTKVVHYFVKEWIKKGHNVLVIHDSHRYPFFVHCLPKVIKNKLAAKIGFVIPSINQIKEKKYVLEGVKVYRTPIFKLIPHGNPFSLSVKKQVAKISKYIDESNFTPDVIMGHWLSPQLDLILCLSSSYKCRSSIVLHGLGYTDEKDNIKKLNKLDRIGFRSNKDMIKMSNLINPKKMFVCYSGISNNYVNNTSCDLDKFLEMKKCINIIFVGRLVKYKNVDIVLNALSKVNFNFRFNIIGEGPELNNLVELSDKLHISDKVKFHGRMQRDEVQKYLKTSHIFAMVSVGEVFGLVYLEAMLASCIVIGTKNEGIDGVVINGKNGYLCNANDYELKNVFSMCKNMSYEQINGLISSAYNTARKFNDSDIADDYLRKAIDER